jgi:hypothetical protein
MWIALRSDPPSRQPEKPIHPFFAARASGNAAKPDDEK